jgi:hypothetical protein
VARVGWFFDPANRAPLVDVTGVLRDVSRWPGEVANFPQQDFAGAPPDQIGESGVIRQVETKAPIRRLLVTHEFCEGRRAALHSIF